MFPAAPSPASRRHLAAARERQSPEVSSQVSGGGRVSNSPTTRRAVHRFEDRSGGLKAAQPGVPSGPPSGTCWSCYAPAGSPPRPSPSQRCSISPSPPASSRSGLTPVSSARPSACLPAASSACHPRREADSGETAGEPPGRASRYNGYGRPARCCPPGITPGGLRPAATRRRRAAPGGRHPRTPPLPHSPPAATDCPAGAGEDG